MTPPRGTSDDRCSCGHRWDEHEHIPGVKFPPSDCIVVNEDGSQATGLPDVWVCSGGRLVDVNNPDLSPWDCVCGCVLHEPPGPPRTRTPIRNVA